MLCGRVPSLLSLFVSMVLALVVVVGKHPTKPVPESNPTIKSPRVWDPPSTDPLVMNASAALSNAGYHIMATAIQMWATELLPPGPATPFAINDPALVNTTLPSWLMLNLFRYHTASEKLLWEYLQILPAGACVPTQLHGKSLVVTATQTVNRAVELNGVPVAHPDIFMAGALAIHGVHRPFHYFDPWLKQALFDPLPLPSSCSGSNAQNPMSYSPLHSRHNINSSLWYKLQLVLRAKGFLSFSTAIKLQVHDLKAAVAGDNVKGSTAGGLTVFAPADVSFSNVSSASAPLGHTVRYHVVPRRLSMADLRRLPVNSKIPTVYPGQDLEITGAYGGIFRPLAINDVPVVRPDAFATKEFVVHGITRAFDLVSVTGTT